MLMRPFRLLPFALSILLAAGAGAAEPKAKPPAGVAPLPSKSARHLDELLKAAEKFRGLKARQPVPAGSLDTGKLKEKMTESMRQDLPPEALRSVEAALKAFGFIPETLDLRRYLPELLSSQVAGFYDPEQKYLALVRPSGGKTPSPSVDEDMILVHELTHAIQDQNFDLHKFEIRDPLADAGTARTALIEGDATLVMMDYHFGSNIEKVPGMDAMMGGMLSDPDKFLAMAPDLPGGKEMAAAPAWIRDNLLFGYLQGAAFCANTRRRGGQVLLDYAFTTDPPRSSEQVLHPEKWHTKRDDPVVIELSNLAAILPGYRRAAEGEMGELSIRILLREGLKDAERAAAAAAGWGGDRFAVFEKEGGGRLVAWVTEWDAEADAGEFRSALEALGGGWRVLPFGPTRVVVLRGDAALEAERREALRGRLAAAPARRPTNREIDLAAIGAKPLEMGVEDLQELMKDPSFQAGFQKGLERVRDKERPAGAVSGDGRLYTNTALGFSLRVPEGVEGWTVDGDPSGFQSLMTVSSPDQAVRLTVGYQDLPEGIPADSAPAMVELGMKAMVPGYRKLRQETVESGALRFEDTWFEADVNGVKVQGLTRFVLRDGRIFFLVGVGTAEAWTRHEAPARRILDTFALLPAKETPKP